MVYPNDNVVRRHKAANRQIVRRLRSALHTLTRTHLDLDGEVEALLENHQQWLSLEEIASLLDQDNLSYFQLICALRRLLSREIVESSFHQGKTVYRYVDED